jgi:hypothetical protein
MPLIIRKGLDGAKGATGAQGPGMVIKSLKLDYSSNLSTMVAANPTDNISVAIDVSGTLAADTLTILSNIHVIWLSGCVWTIPIGVTLTINGPFEAGGYQVFSLAGTGKAVFGSGAVKEVCPEWWGAVADRTTDASAYITKACAALNGNTGVVHLNPGTVWVYSTITHPYEVTILDDSGYDGEYSQWVNMQRVYQNTVLPATKDAHGIKYISPHHPAIILDNKSAAGITKNASINFFQNGLFMWQVGKSMYTDNYFTINGNLGETTPANQSSAFVITSDDFRVGIGGQSASGVSFRQQSRYAGSNVIRWISEDTDRSNSMQFYSGSQGWLAIAVAHTTGLVTISNASGTVLGNINQTGEVYGFRKVISNSADSVSVYSTDSGKIFTNASALASQSWALPTAIAGLTYTFVVMAAQPLRVHPASGNAINIAGSQGADAEYWWADAVGESLTLVAVNNTDWIATAYTGTWTQQTP